MTRRIIYAAVLMLAMSAGAFGNCLDDPREIKLDDNNVVRLKSYLCRTEDGPNAAAVKVEFHRLSDVAPDMAAGGTPPSPLFASSIGAPTVVNNQIFQEYSDLLRRFGDTYFVTGENALSTSMPGISGFQEDIPGDKARTILEFPDMPIDYPAPGGIQSLRNKVIPPSVKFFYKIRCKDDAPASRTACRDYSKTDFAHIFWRGMGPATSRIIAPIWIGTIGCCKVREAARPTAQGSGMKWYEAVRNI